MNSKAPAHTNVIQLSLFTPSVAPAPEAQSIMVDNVIPFPAAPRMQVTVNSIPCDDLAERLLRIYRIFGILETNDIENTNGASAGNTHADLIQNADEDSEWTT